MRSNRVLRVLLVVLASFAFTQTAHAQRGGGRGRINKLSGPWMASFSLFYRFPLTSKCNPCDYPDTPFWINLSAGFGRSVDNDLEYPDDLDKSTTVKVFTFEPALQFQFSRIEIDVGYLFNLFYGEAFPAFGRDALDLEFGVKPFDKGESLGWGGLKFSLLATYYWDGITGEDFGALPGTFEEDSDLVVGFGVSYEFF